MCCINLAKLKLHFPEFPFLPSYGLAWRHFAWDLEVRNGTITILPCRLSCSRTWGTEHHCGLSSASPGWPGTAGEPAATKSASSFSFFDFWTRWVLLHMFSFLLGTCICRVSIRIWNCWVSMFNFLWNCQTFPKCLLWASPHPYQHLSVLLIIAIEVVMNWYLTVALICLFLMTNHVKHLFMCLLTVYLLWRIVYSDPWSLFFF